MERLGELRATLEPVRLAARTPQLVRTPKASRPVRIVFLPGLGASDRSSLPMRAYLSSIGHDVSGWGLGRHGRDPRSTTERFIPHLESIVAADGTAALVGWSLGGVVARETARMRPDLVSQVVTYGTPLAGPRFTSASGLYSPSELEAIEHDIASANDTPIAVPVTALFSKRDGVVHWATCIDRVTPGVQNVEVRSSHLGMGLDPDVWMAVAAAIDGASASH